MVRLLVHAPTPDALVRARRNIANLLAADPSAEVELVVNGAATRAALDRPDPETDRYLVVCANSLTLTGTEAPEGTCIVGAAILHIARRQAEGWGYFRA